MKDGGGDGGYIFGRSLLVDDGEGEVRDVEVNAGHRRRQTGSNWREPASPTTKSLDGGEVG